MCFWRIYVAKRNSCLAFDEVCGAVLEQTGSTNQPFKTINKAEPGFTAKG